MGGVLRPTRCRETKGSVGSRLVSGTFIALAVGLVCASVAVGAQPYETYTFVRDFGTSGEAVEKTTAPWSDAIDAHGNIWVTNYAYGGKSRIEVYSASGKWESDVVEKTGSAAGDVNGPIGIDYDPSNKDMLVADSLNRRIDEFNEAGGLVRAFGFGVITGEKKIETCTTSCRAGLTGTEAGEFDDPMGVASSANGNIWVTDYEADRVDEYTEAGGFVAAFGFGVVNGKEETEECTTTTGCQAGKPGAGKGQFNHPAYLAFSRAGSLYVTDLGNDRIEEFGTAMERIGSFGEAGSSNLQFNSPAGIAVGANGYVYVADQGNHRIQMLKEEGGYFSQFGSAGTELDEFGNPHGITVSPDGSAYVVDTANQRVAEWEPIPPPVNLEAPTISGTAEEGQTLTAGKGTWTNAPETYSYQWKEYVATTESYQPIEGATSSTYTLGALDSGHKVEVEVGATNSDGTTWAISAPAATVGQTTTANLSIKEGGTNNCHLYKTAHIYEANEACASVKAVIENAECGDVVKMQPGTYGEGGEGGQGPGSGSEEFAIKSVALESCTNPVVFEPSSVAAEEKLEVIVNQIQLGVGGVSNDTAPSWVTFKGLSTPFGVAAHEGGSHITFDRITGGRFYNAGPSYVTVENSTWGPCYSNAEEPPSSEVAASQRIIHVAFSHATGAPIVIGELNGKTKNGESEGGLTVGTKYWEHKVSSTEIELATSKTKAESSTASEHIEYTAAIKTNTKWREEATVPRPCMNNDDHFDEGEHLTLRHNLIHEMIDEHGHWECLFLTSINHVLIEGNRFQTCQLYGIFIQPNGNGGGKLENLTVQNNWFANTQEGEKTELPRESTLTFGIHEHREVNHVLIAYNSLGEGEEIINEEGSSEEPKETLLVGNISAPTGTCQAGLTYEYNFLVTTLRSCGTGEAAGAVPYESASRTSPNYTLAAGASNAKELVPYESKAERKVEWDFYGNRRKASGPWNAGAVE